MESLDALLLSNKRPTKCLDRLPDEAHLLLSRDGEFATIHPTTSHRQEVLSRCDLLLAGSESEHGIHRDAPIDDVAHWGLCDLGLASGPESSQHAHSQEPVASWPANASMMLAPTCSASLQLDLKLQTPWDALTLETVCAVEMPVEPDANPAQSSSMQRGTARGGRSARTRGRVGNRPFAPGAPEADSSNTGAAPTTSATASTSQYLSANYFDAAVAPFGVVAQSSEGNTATLLSNAPGFPRGLSVDDVEQGLRPFSIASPLAPTAAAAAAGDLADSNELTPVVDAPTEPVEAGAVEAQRRRIANVARMLVEAEDDEDDDDEADESDEAEEDDGEMERPDGGIVGGSRATAAPSAASAFNQVEEATLLLPSAQAASTLANVDLYSPTQGADPTKDLVLKSDGRADADNAAGPEVTREWAVMTPVDVSNFDAQIPQLAMEYPFELDTFQKRAVLHLEKGESVFIAAHTSAGKTVVAEYAIALAMEHRTRVVYTSPIKALSNQKFRDFEKKFKSENVGLITGDVSINPSAACLVMTTEILRSMLYRGADLVRDIEWVIFDEVHYINDSERGVVWEEVIIMLPAHVGMIFLSATTPNTKEFSAWVGRTKQRPIHVISTPKRPVPLEHYLYAGGQMHRVMDGKKRFMSEGHSAAARALRSAKDNFIADNHKKGAKAVMGSARHQTQQWKHGGGGGNSKTDKATWLAMMRDLQKKELLPVVVFSFSKRKCEERAASLGSLDLTTASEKSQTHVVITGALKRLQGTDRELPQVRRVKQLAAKGIAVHHGGLLPILKEVVEILFGRGLVKVLFATETFAMGVNMPTRTVVFNGLRKHDGKQFRDLTPGEYSQMTGRAGRRGMDKVGTVLISCSADQGPPPLEVLNQMMTGQPTKLESQFRLTYNMILNLLRASAELSVADMIKRSFSEFGAQSLYDRKDLHVLIHDSQAKAKALRASCVARGMDQDGEEFVLALRRSNVELSACLLEGLAGIKSVKKALPPGRVVLISRGARMILQPAVIVESPVPELRNVHVAFVVQRKSKRRDELIGATSTTTASSEITWRTKNILLSPRSIGMVTSEVLPLPITTSDNEYEAQVPASAAAASPPPPPPLRQASSTSDSAPLTPPDLQLNPATEAWLIAHHDLGSRLRFEPANPVSDLLMPPTEPAHNLRIAYSNYSSLVSTAPPSVEAEAAVFPMLHAIHLESRVHQAQLVFGDENTSLYPEFQARLQILRHLGYVDPYDSNVHLKGRVACEINTCDELLLSELLFHNVFEHLDPAETVAALSALVFQGGSRDESATDMPTDRLEEARVQMLRIAANVHAIQAPLREAEWLRNAYNFGLVHVVYQWARGMPFIQLCEITSAEEGTIVRNITRLHETCREVGNVAQVLGDPLLVNKMKEASEAIKRGIVFAASLYTTN